MSEKKQGFFFERVRSDASGRRRLVIQGYAVDGYLDTMKPRAAVFVGGRPVKALPCTIQSTKLPLMQMKRRNGETISHYGTIYVDMTALTEERLQKYGNNAKLVVVGEVIPIDFSREFHAIESTGVNDPAAEESVESDDNEKTLENSRKVYREILYKDSMKKVLKELSLYNMSIDLAYVEDGKTIISGWMDSGEDTIIKVKKPERKDKNAPADKSQQYLKYSIKFSEREDVSAIFPEFSDEMKPGFELIVEGEHKRLNLILKKGDRFIFKRAHTSNSSDVFSKVNVISRYQEKLVRNLNTYGVRETISKIKVHMSPSYINLNRNYDKWIRSISPGKLELEKQKVLQADFKYRPLLSVLVPLYETDEQFLKELIDSITAQTYPNWELCFSDGSRDSDRLSKIIGRYSREDRRIRYVAELPGPLGISSNTNQAFSIAKGDFIVLGDHDDLFTPDAFYEAVRAMNRNLVERPADRSKLAAVERKKSEAADQSKSEAADIKKGEIKSEQIDETEFDTEVDVIYTDEDKTNADAKKRFEPNIKPDFNIELLESCNYITHMFVARKSLVDEVGLFDDAYNGAQDYDFILRCTEKARKIVHVPMIVYSWRINDTSTAGNPAAKMYAYDAGVNALQAHFERLGIEAKAEISDHLGFYHSTYPVPEHAVVYVAVMDADDNEKYERTVRSIEEKSSFKNISFLRIRGEEHGYNFAREMNYAAMLISGQTKEADDTFICFIQSGITMMGENGITGMLSYLNARPYVSAIGGKVFSLDGTFAHAGVIIDFGSIEGWMYAKKSKFDDQYYNYCAYTALRRGVTLFRLRDLQKYGHLNERYTGEQSLVEYTYEMTRDGRTVVYDAGAEFLLKPDRGKDADNSFETISNKLKEFGAFMKAHKEIYKEGDKYYSNSIRKELK